MNLDQARAEMGVLRLLGSLKADAALVKCPGSERHEGYYYIRCPVTEKLHWVYLAHPDLPSYDISWTVLADLEGWIEHPNLELVLETWDNWRVVLQQKKAVSWHCLS